MFEITCLTIHCFLTYTYCELSCGEAVNILTTYDFLQYIGDERKHLLMGSSSKIFMSIYQIPPNAV